MLYQRFINNIPFAFLNGSDVYPTKFIGGQWNKFHDSPAHTPFKEKLYGFFTKGQALKLYRDELIKEGLVPVASRGEGARLIMTRVTDDIKAKAQNRSDYLASEVAIYEEGGYIVDDEYKKNLVDHLSNIFDKTYLDPREAVFLQDIFKGNYNKYVEHWIARHEAYKALFSPDYIMLAPEVLMKRIKIPFTPVYTSPMLSDRKYVFFDSKGAKLRIKNAIGGDIIKDNDLQQDIDNILQYIRDGATWTSESVFDEYVVVFGNGIGTKRAKTVHFNNTGGSFMAKHQEMTARLKDGEIWEILDANGGVVATIRKNNDGKVNIYAENGDLVHYLMSNDEAKVRLGQYNKDSNIYTMPGNTVGLIQYTKDHMKNKSIFTTQLSYYLEDEGFQNFIMKKFFDRSPDNKHSAYNLSTKLFNWYKNPDTMRSLMKDLSSAFYDVVPKNIEELGEVGAGKHPSTLPFIREILKNKVLKSIADFNMEGTHLDFRPDDRGDVKDDEMVMPDHRYFMKKVQERMGKENFTWPSFEDKLYDMNEWLKKNKIYVNLTRSPITSKMGFGVYRVSELDPTIGDSFIISAKEAKERYEADYDHDTGHIVFLDDEMAQVMLSYQSETKGLDMSKYAKTDIDFKSGNLSDGMSMINNMTVGETAIGESVNVARYAGVLNSMFKRSGEFTFIEAGGEVPIKVRNLDDLVEDKNIMLKDDTHFKAPLREYIRILLQAAVDHPKLLLLNEWDYDLANITKKLFYNPSDPFGEISDQIYNSLKIGFINPILKLNSHVDNMFEAGKGPLKFNEVFEKSSEYSAFMQDREGTILKLNDDLIEEEKRKNEEKQDAGEDIDDDKFAMIKSVNVPAGVQPSSLQELVTVYFDDVLARSGMTLDEFYNINPRVAQIIHTNTVRNIHSDIMTLIDETYPDISKEDKQRQIGVAASFAGKMQNALFELSKDVKEEGKTEVDYYEKVSAKSWDYADEYIKFYKVWSDQYANLPSDFTREAATMVYLSGLSVENSLTGKKTKRKSLNALPPVKRTGATTLDPHIMNVFFEEFNKIYDAYIKDDKILNEISDTKMPNTITLLKEKLGCG